MFIHKAADSLAPPARLELTTLRLGGVRSIQVSYGGICNQIVAEKAICVKYRIPLAQRGKM